MMRDLDPLTNTTSAQLSFMAFRCGQLMAMISKLMPRDDFNPVEQLMIQKAQEQLNYAGNLLSRIEEK